MTEGKLRTLSALLTGLIVVMSGVIIYLVGELRYHQLRPGYLPDDQVLIGRAAQREVERNPGLAIDEYFKTTHPVVMEFPDKTCVELRPTADSFGESSVYCFSSQTGLLLNEVQ